MTTAATVAAVAVAVIAASATVGVLAWVLGWVLGAALSSLRAATVPLVGLARRYWHALLSRPKGNGRGLSSAGKHSTRGTATHPAHVSTTGHHPRPVETTLPPMTTPAPTSAPCPLCGARPRKVGDTFLVTQHVWPLCSPGLLAQTKAQP